MTVPSGMQCYRCDAYADVAVRAVDGSIVEYVCETCETARLDREIERQKTVYAEMKARQASR